MAARKALPQIVACQRAQGARTQIRLGQAACILGASFEPRGVGNGHELKIQKEINFPHSLGLLYAAFTYYTGFKVNSGEYKVMGLAPYGIPKYAQLIYDNLIDLKPDGSFRLNLDYFNYCTGLTMTNERFDALFDGAPRMPAAPLEQRHMDLAASIQVVIEEAALRLTPTLAA